MHSLLVMSLSELVGPPAVAELILLTSKYCYCAGMRIPVSIFSSYVNVDLPLLFLVFCLL